MMEEVQRPEELMINHATRLWKDTGNIASALGYLAVFWSTVVLLGGFVSDLLLKEFWVLTALSFIMSFKMIEIGINELGRNLYMEEIYIATDILGRRKWTEGRKYTVIYTVMSVANGVKLVFLCLFFLLFLVSPVVNLGVSVWRLVRRDYGDAGGDIPNRAKMMAALVIFYALILLQSLFAIYFVVIDFYLGYSMKSMNKHTGLFEDWGSKLIGMYQRETERKLKESRDPPGNWNLIAYGVELLQSASEDDRLWGARVLDSLCLFDKELLSVRGELLSSRLSIENLIGMIGRRGTDKIENKERAARIVAHLASDLHITHFPGTLQCIYSLLECCKQYGEPQVIRPLENPEHGLPHPDTKDQHGSLETADHQDDSHIVSMPDKTDHRDEQGFSLLLRTLLVEKAPTRFGKLLIKKRNEIMGVGPPNPYSHPYKTIGTKELIAHGLMILEGLTQDQVNCTEIIKHQLLLSEITSPLRRHDILSNVRDRRMVEILRTSLTVVSKLLGSLGDGATSLRQELVSNTEAVSNLMGILETDSNGAHKLHEEAIEILTKLAFDGSFQKQDFNKLFNALLCIFLDEEASNTLAEQADKGKATKLRVKAGESLATLLPVCSARYANVADILPEQEAINLLTKVLDQILSSEMGTTAVKAKGDPASNEKQLEEERCLTAMLSLAVVICNEGVISKENFAYYVTPEDDEALTKKLKEILEVNKNSTAECLRIVKLICQVVIAMIKVKPRCIQIFNGHNFKKALAEALETMSEVDDCMLFAGNDRDVIKHARSLAFLVKEAQELMQTA